MKRKLWLGLSALFLLLALTFPVNAQSGRALFNWIIADRILVQDGGLTVTGPSALADTALTGDMSLTGDLDLTAQTAITVTNGATLTPLGAYQPIRSSGNVGFGAITAGSAGQLLVLTNQTNTTITITDTGTLKLAGNVALGQNDSVTLISDATNWYQLATSNN